MLTQRFKIELCRPVGACIMSDSPIRRVSPYAVLCRPFPTSRDKSRLAFDNEFGSTCISLPKSFHTLNKIEFTLFIFPRCETREDKKGGCLTNF